jgi:hypothetical protein
LTKIFLRVRPHKTGVKKTEATAAKKEILFERSELISFRLWLRFLARVLCSRAFATFGFKSRLAASDIRTRGRSRGRGKPGFKTSGEFLLLLFQDKRRPPVGKPLMQPVTFCYCYEPFLF